MKWVEYENDKVAVSIDIWKVLLDQREVCSQWCKWIYFDSVLNFQSYVIINGN